MFEEAFRKIEITFSRRAEIPEDIFKCRTRTALSFIVKVPGVSREGGPRKQTSPQNGPTSDRTSF